MSATLAHHARGVAHALGNVLLVAWLLFATIVIVVRYAVLPNVDRYRGDIEQAASRAAGETVTIGAIATSWHGLLPTVSVRDVRIVDGSGAHVFVLPALRATLSWDSLLVFRLRLARLDVEAPQLIVRRDATGQLFVAGYAIKKRTTPDSKVAEWLLEQGDIRVHGAQVVWRDEMREGEAPVASATLAATQSRPDLVMSDVTIALDRSGRGHRFALRATPPAELAAPIDVRAQIDPEPFATHPADPASWSGELYADVASGDIVAWRRWLPLPATVDAGRGRVRAWMTFNRADAPAGVFAQRLAQHIRQPIPAELDRISGVTVDLALDDLAARWGAMADAPEYASIGSVDGRVDASQSMTEQRLSALHMALEPAQGTKVPATDFTMQRTIGAAVDDESGKASLGAIDIGVSLGLVPVALIPAPVAAKLTALKPRGSLAKVDVQWTGPIAAPKTFRAETRFERLAIAPQAPTPEAIAAAAHEVVEANGLVRRARKAFGQPGFDHLNGTITATRSLASGDGGAVARTEATVLLDGTDATLIAPGLFDEPTIRLAHLTAQLGVRMEGSDVEVRLDHGTLDNPDLAGTVAMTLRRGPHSGGVGTDGGRGWIDLDARLSRADVGRVPRYLPNIISERARLYLGRALVAGQVAEANLRMRGPLDRLNLRVMPGALATPNPIDVRAALAAVRDAPVKGRPADTPKPAVGTASGATGAASTDTIFHALIRVHNATFLYAPGRRPGDPAPLNGLPPSPTASIPWPAFTDLDADVVFDHTKMTVYARSARVYDYRLTDVSAELPALADPKHVLRVSGKGTGALQDLIRFMNNSPISRWLRHFTDNTKATGNAALALAFDLPLSNPRNTDLAGSLHFTDNDLALNAIVPPLLNINGRMDFSDRGLTIDDLTATALGGPVRVDATTGKDGYIALNANGTIDVAALQKSSHEDEPDGIATPVANAVDRAATFLSGSTRYTVALRVRSKRVTDLSDSADPQAAAAATAASSGPSQPDLVVQSDLVGLAIALPEPLSKAAGDRWPLRIELARTIAAGSPTPDREDVHVTLADRVDVNIVRRPNAQGQLAVTRAGYRVGDGSATSSGPSDITIQVPYVDVDAWRAALKNASAPKAAVAQPPPNAAVDALMPVRATLKTPSVRAYGRAFTNVAVTAERTPAGWQADVDADQVAGHLSYTDVSGHAETRNGVAPAASAKLVARLSKVIIPASDTPSMRIDQALDANQQRDFPAVDVIVDRFELRGRTLGRLAVIAENIDVGSEREWRLEKLDLTTPEARFAASGTWGRNGEAGAGAIDHTSLDFNLRASDVGALMDRFGLTRTIKNGTATLTGNVAWNGGPSTIDFDSLSGSMKLAADKGQFLKAEPGISKLLNILSLQGLARRLKLDFSDVFDAGFAFDTVRADATMDHGVASTEDFTMRGVEAIVRMSGTANLAQETTNLHVIVEPQINAGAASLGLAIVNPVIGLATFAAQYLFKDEITRALTFEYNVVGPWKKPEVTKIDRHGNETRVVPRVAPRIVPQLRPPSTQETSDAGASDR